MATDMNFLMGEVEDNPELQERDVEQLLVGFLRALIEEQRLIKSREPHFPHSLQGPPGPTLSEAK